MKSKGYFIKRFIFFFLIPIFLSCGGGGGGDSDNGIPSSSHWAKIYGVDGVGEIGGYIQQTDDGGYILAGTGLPPGRHKSFRFLVIKLNSEGGIVWQKYFDREDFDDEVYSVYETGDGGYIVGGESYLPSESFYLIIKLNSNGNIIWQKLYKYGGSHISPTKDGGYVVSGWCISKIDSSGNFEWGRSYDDKGGSIKPTSDGGYIMTQYETEVRHESGSYIMIYRVKVIRLNKNGSVIWAKSYESNQIKMYGGPIEETEDGGYILGIGGEETLVKLDSQGNIVWAKAYKGIGDIVDIRSLHQTRDGGYIMAGDVQDADYCAGDSMWVLKTDPAGNVVWAKGYGEGALALGGYVIESGSGDYVVSGSMAFYQDYPHLWVLKLHPDGTISPDAPPYLGVDINPEVQDISSFITVKDTTLSVNSCTVNVEDASVNTIDANIIVTTIASE